jgi:hypothetical protein
MKRIKLTLGVLCAFFLFSGSALAVVIEIETPMDYDTQYLVGTAAPGTAASNEANRLIWANAILALDANTTSGIYRTGSTEYDGVLSLDDGFLSGGGTSIEAGWEYVLAKYNGQNAGYVLFYLGGNAAIIPQESSNLWLNPSDNGYGLSGWTAFSPTQVPEPATLFLLALGLLMIAFARRRRDSVTRAHA